MASNPKHHWQFSLPRSVSQSAWLFAGVLLIGYQVRCLPDLFATVREPERWHGFEMTISWWFIYATPVIFLIGVAMIVKSFRR